MRSKQKNEGIEGVSFIADAFLALGFTYEGHCITKKVLLVICQQQGFKMSHNNAKLCLRIVRSS